MEEKICCQFSSSIYTISNLAKLIVHFFDYTFEFIELPLI